MFLRLHPADTAKDGDGAIIADPKPGTHIEIIVNFLLNDVAVGIDHRINESLRRRFGKARADC